MIWTVAKKELRGYFNSPVAAIVLAAFLLFAFLMFFWVEKFFARGLADLRPLFKWMPLLLVVLVPALAMRLWADERRTGTIEVLLTLPIQRWRLVVGKFVAGMLLIALALGLTLGLPVTIAQMGSLDTGPVIGGYLAALLLSAAYLSIGMCISAATDNQIIAFIGTAVVCGALYAVGLVDNGVSQFIGTGVRFESVARGVLDLRDLAYYGSITCVALALNVLLLGRLTWGRGPRARPRRLAAVITLGLIAANAVVLDLWLAPVRRARVDLTEDGIASLSSSTRTILAGLDAPLLIRGYFSSKTHPKLSPLLPQLRDLLEEYQVAGGGDVRVELIDPTAPEDQAESDRLKRDAKERFDISPTPLRFASATEKSVIDAYFAIAIQYGDQHAVVTLDELIQVHSVDVGDLEITLRNPEYEVTKAIKKAAAAFSSVDALFAAMPGTVKLTTYVTPKSLPDKWKEVSAKLQKAIDELAKESGGKLTAATVEPAGEAQMRDLYTRYGLRPYQLDPFSGTFFYLHVSLQVGDRIAWIAPQEDTSDAALKTALTDGLKRAAPGFTRVVGLWGPPAPPPMNFGQGMPPREMPPPQQFQTIRRSLSGNYEVRDIALDTRIADDVEVLVLGGPANLGAKEAETIDQFVMRGGALVVLAGRYRLDAMGGGIAVEKVATGLEAVFQKWGITVDDKLIMDTKADSLPVPQDRDLGNGIRIREMRQQLYPFFLKIDGRQLSTSNVITSALAGVVIHWASPVKAEAKVGDDAREVETLLASSDGAWLTTSIDVMPNTQTYPELGFPGPKDGDTKGTQVLAVAVTGGFASNFAKTKDTKDAAPPSGGAGSPPLLEHSPPGTRIVVFGGSAFASDDLLQVTQQLDPNLAQGNIQLVQNAVDWALADTDLLAIRGHNTAARALTIGPDKRNTWLIRNIVIAVIGLAIVIAISLLRRRAIKPVIAGGEA